MLKQVIGKIVEAERTAEDIERQALDMAESIKSKAELQSQSLISQPDKQTRQQADKIVAEAEINAQKEADKRVAEADGFDISQDLIDKAADAIVARFLKRGL